jgi:UDP-perosamine 4-acetyltransferase
MGLLKAEKYLAGNKDSVDSLPVIVVGAGGHARVLIEMLGRSGIEILGLVDPAHRSGDRINGIPIIGDDSVIDNYSNGEIRLVNGVGALPGQSRRVSIAEKFRAKGYQFRIVIDPNTCIASDVEVSEGVQIMPGVIIQPGTKIGQDTILNTGVNVDHDCKIGANVHIAPGSTLSGNVTVFDGVHIGTGTTIIQSVEIGGESIIGAGCVIVSDVKNNQKIVQKKENTVTQI